MSTLAADPAVSASAVPSGAPSDGGAGGGSEALTDDAILGITAEEASPSPSPESAPQATAEPQPKPDAAPTPVPGAGDDITLDEIKALYSSPLGPKLQRLFDQHTAIRTAFGTIADGRRAAQAIQQVGGVAKLEEFIADAVDVGRSDSIFQGGSPAERKGLVGEYLQQWGVDPIIGMAQASLEAVREADAARYGEFSSGIAKDWLKTENMPKFMAFAHAALNADDTTAAQYGFRSAGEMLADVVSKFLNWGSKRGLVEEGGALATERAKLNADREMWQKEQNDARQQEFERNTGEASTRAETSIRTEIEKTLDGFRLGDGRKVAMPEFIREQVVQKIFDSVREKALQNTVAQSTIRALAAGASRNPDTYAKMEQAYLSAMQRLLPGAFEEVMTKATGHLVSAAKGAAKAAGAATRVDIGTGVSTGKGQGAGKLKPSDVRSGGKHAGLSDDDILNL